MTGGALLPASAWSAASASSKTYPPLRTGLRGSHPGSFEVAHSLGRHGVTNWGPVTDAKDSTYDLVVVGAGISGLSAAHFYRKQNPDARILILDNHDDFGGHAKRNEFSLDGRTVIGYGGAQSLEEPGWYGDASKTLLRDLGVDKDRFYKLFDQEFFRRNELAGATYFNKARYGSDSLVPYSILDYASFVDADRASISAAAAVLQMPLGERARAELLRLLETNKDLLTDIPAEQQSDYLARTSYAEFLSRHFAATDPELLALLDGLTGDSGCSIQASSTLAVAGYVGLPGMHATAIADEWVNDEPYIFHFPDGNASIARLLVRSLIPGVADGSSMEDIVLADFDYSRLDTLATPVRLRLNSTVVNIEHDGDLDSAGHVLVRYVQQGKTSQVKARQCVLAGYNQMIPHMCPELPATQGTALSMSVKSPIIYTNVLLRNWQAWKELGLAYFSAPGDYYHMSMLDYPVSMGGYEFSKNPDEPILVHMERFPKGDDPLASQREQFRAGRRELFETPYADIERATRMQLAGALGGADFDPARDIAAITVNRWGHGYAGWYNPQFDDDYEDGSYPHQIGRQRFGRISIANSDAGAEADINTAIEQAYRAVGELSS